MITKPVGIAYVGQSEPAKRARSRGQTSPANPNIAIRGQTPARADTVAVPSAMPEMAPAAGDKMAPATAGMRPAAVTTDIHIAAGNATMAVTSAKLIFRNMTCCCTRSEHPRNKITPGTIEIGGIRICARAPQSLVASSIARLARRPARIDAANLAVDPRSMQSCVGTWRPIPLALSHRKERVEAACAALSVLG
jgi:hypothetical protein